MIGQQIAKPNELPVDNRNRHCTDIVCLIIAVLLALTMFILAIVFWSQSNYDRLFSGSATDANGVSCPGAAYISNPNDLQSSVCVSSCPVGFGATNRGICLPNDSGQLSNYMSNPDISASWDSHAFRNVLFYAFIIALSFGFLWTTFTHCLPRFAPIVAFVGAIILLFTLGILILLNNYGFWGSNGGLKIALAIFCFILAVIMVLMLSLYHNEIKFQGLLLEYARVYLNEYPSTFIYIPVYMLFTAGLVALIVWQHASFAGKFGSSRNFWNFANGGVLDVLNILEFIWGLQFLRDSFNFCVSGNSIEWYWTRKTSVYNPYKRLLSYHLGSVFAGSFLNAFFEIPTLIIELLVCHPQACCGKCGTSMDTCNNLFDLVRTDAYSYINLTAIPFCNAATECKELCRQSNQFIGHHSAMKHYRFAAHVFAVSAVALMTYFILKAQVANFGFWHLTIGVVTIYMTLTWFINIHADAAEGIQTGYLAEHRYEKGNFGNMGRVLPAFRDEFALIDNRKAMDGNVKC